MGKSSQSPRQLISRLHRIHGQTAAVEKYLESSDPLLALTQLEAINSAIKSLIREYIRYIIESDFSQETKDRALDRLIKKN